tara:strand:- start:199 stop:615 length:417 start_codon:yes stop_codon:yes gene_type:complete
MKINVKFLWEKPENGIDGGVFAFFPNEKYNHEKGMFTSYAHIGQHSACHIDYANECKEAKLYEYYDLLRELYRQGYKSLNVLNSEKIECWRQPTKGEIKFGEGAIHYKDFTLSEMGLNSKGDLKKWFICKDDGLRYYR